ncbi:inositol 1,4,5-trisphosphate receptor type 2-like [Mizuhopecten yessoensis]|uniref:inositol 1,4,5-trisphosphate receptor type 2-like n=1 Tax=Mizuhopecten yessoensis TaxID=6573 RepID=UPI000B45AB17|nr:inositol 1,4,5-trisphosphate receptor type 2-like [Mizuhopecten yessoensis]
MMMLSNTAAGEYLNVGDYVALYSVETEGYVYSVQSSSVHSGLYINHNQDREKPSKIPNPQAVVFEIGIQNRYKLNKKYRKWVNQAASTTDLTEDKGLLAQAKFAADAENADNAAEQKRQMGKRVRYGDIVQLKHALTNKYIHMCTSQTSQTDKNNMVIMLQDFNAKNAQFRILPQYKVKSEGEVVQIYDQIVFESIKSPGHFFHASSAYQIDHITHGSEVNLGVERSGFTLVRFHKGIPEHDPYVRGGSAIRLFHKELEAYLVAEGLFDEEVTEDVHFRIRVMDQHKPRTLSPPTSGNTFWQIEAESGILNGDILRWEQQVRLRHMTTRKYLCIDATKEISLTDESEDPRTVFRLYSVISERDEIRFESYCRIEHVLTGFWLHALKDEDYIRKKFRNMDSSEDQSLRGLRWDSAQVREVAASGESQYDDAFTIQFVEQVHQDEFNYISGMVPFLLNLIKDVKDRHFLNAKRTHVVLTAMEGIRKFMIVKTLPSKNRQKLMRNLRVIDLLVKILKCPLDGTADEQNMIQVFKEAYEILYTYMIGKSRKNALYFAKYIEFFQTQFTQKGGIGLNVAQMIVELIRDKRKIVDRITHEQINEFVGLLQKTQNYRFLDLMHVLCVCDDVAIPNNQSYIVQRWMQEEQGRGIYLTGRGQDINRQPNILYITTNGGKTWDSLHTFVDPKSEDYDKDKHDFLIHQLDLYKALCHGRNDYSINMITKELRYLTWEETFLSLRSDILPDAIRAKYCDLCTSLFVDVGNNYSVLDHPNICFVYEYVGSKDEEKSQGDFLFANLIKQVVKELVAIFPVLRDWIAEFLQENKCMFADDIGHNMLIEQVLRLLYHLVKFGYYLDAEDVEQLLPPMLNLLDGRHDFPFKKDREKGFSKDAMKLVHQFQTVERLLPNPQTEAIVNAKFQVLEVLDLLLLYQRNSRLQSFVSKFKTAEKCCGLKKSQNVLVSMLFDDFDPHDQSKKALKLQKRIIKDLREMFTKAAIFDVETLTRVLTDLSRYKYNKMITKSLSILNKVYSSKDNVFRLSKKAQILLTQDSARVHREVLKSMPILRRLAKAKLDEQQKKLMETILDDLGEFCHLPMTPDEPHPMNQNILISNGILTILFDILTQDIDTKLMELYRGMKDVFKKTFHLVKLLARENDRVQFHLFDRLDVLLDVRVVESDLAIALKEVFMGNQNTCLKISPRQIQKIVSRAAELQERAPEFLDLLGMIVKVVGTDLTLKRNQAYVMKYIMQNYKKVAYVLDLGREERERILTSPNRICTLRYYLCLLDLLAICAEGENMFIESLCQTILPMDDLLWVLNNPKVDSTCKKPFIRCLHHIYMKSNNTMVDTGSGEMSHNEDLWEYLSNLSIDMNRLTDSIKEDPDKIAIHLKTAPEKSGSASATDFESSAYGSVLYFLEAVLPFLETFYRDFYYPDQTTFGNEVDETDHMAKAVVMFCEMVGPLLYKPTHMKNMVNCLTVIVPISNMPNSNIDHVLDRFSSGITVEDTSSAVRRGNIEYYADEVEINCKFRTFAKNVSVVFFGHNKVQAQLKVKSSREYTELGGNEEIPLGEEFQSHVKCFIHANEKKIDKKYEPAAILIEQLHISMGHKRMSEAARQEMDDLNIKCIQLLRAIVHNEERKMPDDWETRTTEPKIKKALRLITGIQNLYDKKGAMNKALPHLSTRNEELAKEVLGFLCILLFNANTSVQQSMLNYFLSTREEVFFMAVRDRMALSTNSIKEKTLLSRRSLQAQQDAKKKDATDTFGTKLRKGFPVSIMALKQIQAYEDALRQQRLSGWTRRRPPSVKCKKKKKNKKPKAPKERKKKPSKVKDSSSNGLKKEVSFASPLTKEAQALIVNQDMDTELIAIKIEDPPEPEIQNNDDDSSLEYRNDGYIELVLKVMARMCDGQNQHLQDYLREQPDNVKSFNIIAEVTRFLNVVYSNITGKNIDLVIQLFDTMNEFTAGNQENRIVIYDNKIIDYINFILRAGDIEYCSTEKILGLRESIANLILSLIEENGHGASELTVEVKDTLDKKSVLQLITECYEMHQPDKKKLEELKNITSGEVGEPQSKMKSFAFAGGSFLQGVMGNQKDEMADTYMDVGFRLYLILARMGDVDPKLCDQLKMQPLQMKAFNFYKKNCMSIELVKDDELQKVNFRVKNKRVLREEVKESLKWNVDRSSPSNKIRDVMEWTKDIMKDIAYQRKILSNPIAIGLTKGWLIWNHLVTIVSFAINILMLVTWQAKASLATPGIMDNTTAIPASLIDPIPVIQNLKVGEYEMAIYTLGGLHNFFSLLVFISYFVGNHPRMPHFRAIFKSIRNTCSRKKKDDELEEEKKKKHQSKLDAKLFSFTTFYYIAFLGLSVGGTIYHGYFFAFHLLNIVNNNQLLGGVIKAVTQNGKSLLWVAVLGLCVFYLYGIVGFAMMRSMFQPSDYLYCDTLWQCTITVVRYGLIGDLFEVMKAHKMEATFQKFGFVVLYHVSFFIFITTIGLNIIFGIIVDTFSELRDLKWTAEADMRDTCFICSRNSYDFEHHGKGFDHHVQHEHNMWAYIFFFIHLNGTKINDFTALELYVHKLLLKENYDFFPLDRALSLSGMGKDSTETKIDDLLYHVTSIVEKQRKEELEKKRHEERARQKVWEHKHRLGSFRRRAKLPAPLEKDPLTGLPVTPSQHDDHQSQGAVGQVSPQPPSQYLKPVFPQPTGISGRTTPRRFSDVGLVTSMLGQRADAYTPMPSALSRFDRRPSASSRSGSPSRLDHEPQRFRRRSPSRYDDDELLLGSPDHVGDRARSPSRSRMGSESDLRGKSPSPLSRRDTMTSMLSPRWADSRSASPRGATVFFPDTDPFPPPPPPLPTMDRRGSDFRLETVEGPQYSQDFEYPEYDQDDDLYSERDRRRDRRDSHY